MASLVHTHSLVMNFAEDHFRPVRISPSQDEASKEHFADVVRGPDSSLMLEELAARGRDEAVARELVTELSLNAEAIEALIGYNEYRKRTYVHFTPWKIATALVAFFGAIATIVSKDAFEVVGWEDIHAVIQFSVMVVAAALLVAAPFWFHDSVTWREYKRLRVGGELLQIAQCLVGYNTLK